MSDDVRASVDHVFRHEAGRITAWIARRVIPGRLDVAEDAVQFAMMQALRTWPFHGTPDRPGAWLAQVARNKALELGRAERRQEQIAAADLGEQEEQAAPPPDAYFDGEIGDDRLALLFACCHPVVPHASRVALTLNVASGFGVRELARAFVADPVSVAQRLVRAKRQLADEHVVFELPAGAELRERLDSVLSVLYLAFNEGYDATSGEDWVRVDLCAETLRLVELVAGHPETSTPTANALAALLYLLAARLPARLDEHGLLLLLEEQDRTLWDRRAIAAGLAYLERAAHGSEITPYHLQAEIAALHTAAPSFADTDWAGIIGLYDELLAIDASPIVALGRAVAISGALGPKAGLTAIAAIQPRHALDAYLPLHAVRGELLRRSGDLAGASEAFEQAAALPCSEAQRRFLTRKGAECRAARIN